MSIERCFVSRAFTSLISGLFLAAFAFGQDYNYNNTYNPNQPAVNPGSISPGSMMQPLRTQPSQTPPKAVLHNGVPVYGTDGQAVNPQPNRTAPPAGYGSPFPTGLPANPAPAAQPQPQPMNRSDYPVRIASTQTDPQRGSIYGLGLPPAPQIAETHPVIGQEYRQPVNPAVQPVQPQPAERQPVHAGRAAPEARVIPFFLTPEEQIELNNFLVRWEKYSEGIRRYDVEFNMFRYDATIPGEDLTKAHKTTFGFFKYIAKPTRFVYCVEGEWVGKEQVKRDDNPKTANIFAEKIIIDEKSVFSFDYNAKKVLQINVPPEMIGRGIADSPLPLIFGAKAADMKRRFSMKIKNVNSGEGKEQLIVLQAKPLLAEDQQEFALIELLLDKNTFRAKGLKRCDIGDKAFTVYELQSPVINNNLSTVLSDIKTYFTPSVPRGWKREVNDWVLDVQMAKREQPNTIPAGIAPPIGSPQPTNLLPVNPSYPRSEIPLYTPNTPR
jgi:TIGR03009 family protein